MATENRKYLGARAVCTRYDIADRTLDRWVETGELPKPIYISGRRFWDRDALDHKDEARQSEAA